MTSPTLFRVLSAPSHEATQALLSALLAANDANDLPLLAELATLLEQGMARHYTHTARLRGCDRCAYGTPEGVSPDHCSECPCRECDGSTGTGCFCKDGPCARGPRRDVARFDPERQQWTTRTGVPPATPERPQSASRTPRADERPTTATTRDEAPPMPRVLTIAPPPLPRPPPPEIDTVTDAILEDAAGTEAPFPDRLAAGQVPLIDDAAEAALPTGDDDPAALLRRIGAPSDPLLSNPSAEPERTDPENIQPLPDFSAATANDEEMPLEAFMDPLSRPAPSATAAGDLPMAGAASTPLSLVRPEAPEGAFSPMDRVDSTTSPDPVTLDADQPIVPLGEDRWTWAPAPVEREDAFATAGGLDDRAWTLPETIEPSLEEVTPLAMADGNTDVLGDPLPAPEEPLEPEAAAAPELDVPTSNAPDTSAAAFTTDPLVLRPPLETLETPERVSPDTPSPVAPRAMPSSPPTPAPAAAAPAPQSAQPPRGRPPRVKAPRGHNPFLKPDQSTRTRQMARALASDIMTYHRAKVDEGKRLGNLPSHLHDELQRRWDSLKQHVARPTGNEGQLFADALNDLIAGGSPVFHQRLFR